MKPPLSVAANINVCAENHLNLFPSSKVNASKVSASIVSSHKLRLAALYVLLVFSSKGTSIAVIVAHDRIMIAADGIETKTSNGVKTPQKYCKIKNEGSTFYTASGTYSIPEIEFDMWTLARDAIRQSKSVEGAAGLSEIKILKRLNEVVRLSKVIDRDNYARWLTGIPVIAISFASFEHGVPTVSTIQFLIDGTGNIAKPLRRTQQGVPGKALNALLGYNAEMRTALDNPNWGISFVQNPISFVQGLIQREIEASTREKRYDVGLPISIVKITRTGGDWEPGHKGACP